MKTLFRHSRYEFIVIFAKICLIVSLIQISFGSTLRTIYAGSNGQQLAIEVCNAKSVLIVGNNHRDVLTRKSIAASPASCMTLRVSNWWWKGQVRVTATYPDGRQNFVDVFAPTNQSSNWVFTTIPKIPPIGEMYVARAKNWITDSVRYGLFECPENDKSCKENPDNDYYNFELKSYGRSANAKEGWYRTDCSGFISYAWNLDTSPNTEGLYKTYAYNIDYKYLLPGDIINSNPKFSSSAAHVILFVGWVDKAKGEFLAFEETKSAKEVAREYTYTIKPKDGTNGYDLFDPQNNNASIDSQGTLSPWFAQRKSAEPQANSTAVAATAATNIFFMDFEKFGSWKRGNQVWATFESSQGQAHSGNSAGKFTYNFPASADNFVVYRQSVRITGQPNALQIWVNGDDSNNYLNAWVKDKNNAQWQFTFGQITHTGWQQMTAYLSTASGWPNRKISGEGDQPAYPLAFDGLVLDGIDGKTSQGVIYVDDLTATTITTPPPIPQPVSAPAQPANDAPIPVAAPASSITFTTDRENINAGECTTLKWSAPEVNGVWLNDNGVSGQASQQVCPTQTQTYKLKIQKRDGTFEERSITIQVSGTAPPVANPPPAPADSGYGTLGVIAADTRRPPESNPDLNLSLLGYQPNGVAATYKDYGPVDDLSAPQFRGLFADHRQPGFTTSFINNGWDWGSNSRTTPSPGKFEVTVIGVAVSPGESLFTPGSGRSIGNGYSALVLYADNNQITLKYTPEDSVARGYTVFIEGINVNSQLLGVYQSTNGAGRSSLPALRAGQLLGTASGGEIRLAIRDNATFMDPRSQQDWWR